MFGLKGSSVIAIALIGAAIGLGSLPARGEEEVGLAVGKHLHALVLEPKGRILLAGTHHGLFRSSDEGKTWEKVPVRGVAETADFMVLAADPARPGVLWATGHDIGVLESSDSGQTWIPRNAGLPSLDVHALAIDPLKPNQMYAWVVDHGLFASRDSGNRWWRAHDGPPNPQVNALHSLPLDTGMGGIFIMAGTAGGLFYIPD